MGDRALIQLVTRNEASPVLYLHWTGATVPSLLDGLFAQMSDRLHDISYSFARLVGRACNLNGGDAESLSVGVWVNDTQNDLNLSDSQGDAGVFRVHLDTRIIWYGGGYPPAPANNTPWTWEPWHV